MSNKPELPVYQSNKIVQGMKIDDIFRHPDGPIFLEGVVDGSRTKVHVDNAYMDKHKPQIGGYFVRHKDGYESWSPAQAFEEGHTRIETNIKPEQSE